MLTITSYDEDRWPSGTAGGKVIKDNPDFKQKKMKFTPNFYDGDLLAAYIVELDDNGCLKSYRILKDSELKERLSHRNIWFAYMETNGADAVSMPRSSSCPKLPLGMGLRCLIYASGSMAKRMLILSAKRQWDISLNSLTSATKTKLEANLVQPCHAFSRTSPSSPSWTSLIHPQQGMTCFLRGLLTSSRPTRKNTTLTCLTFCQNLCGISLRGNQAWRSSGIVITVRHPHSR